MSNYRRRIKPIYCWELERWFNNQSEASKFLIEEKGLSHSCLGELNKWMNHVDRIVGGYHWCDSLHEFEGKELYVKERRGVSKKIICWETKKEYENVKSAAKETRIDRSALGQAVNNPYKTAAGFHWCTDLSIFEGIDFKTLKLSYDKIYCYETKKEFISDSEFSAIKKIIKYFDEIHNHKISDTNFPKVVNNPKRSVLNFHFCTDLNIFEGLSLTGDNKNYGEDRISNEKKSRTDNVVGMDFTVREIVPEDVDYESLYKFPIKIFHEIIDYILKKEIIEQLNDKDSIYYFKARRDYEGEITDRAYIIFHSICPKTKNILEIYLKDRALPDLDLSLEWDDETMSFSKLTFQTGFGLADYQNIIEDEDTFEELENVSSIEELYTKIEDENY